MATCLTCCHLPGEMLNSAAKCADRARIGSDDQILYQPMDLWVRGLYMINQTNVNTTLMLTKGQLVIKLFLAFVFLLCNFAYFEE
jgi:hypothetical protein